MPGLQLGAASAAPRCAGLRSGNIPDVRSFIARQQQDSLPHFFNPNLSVRCLLFDSEVLILERLRHWSNRSSIRREGRELLGWIHYQPTQCAH